eukprot:EG_transcript_489
MGSDNYWELLRRKGQKRNAAPGLKPDRSQSASKGDHPRKPWGPALAGHDIQERALPYPWTKNSFSGKDLSKGRSFNWKDHRAWCEKVWEEGAHKVALKEVQTKVASIQQGWWADGDSHRVPQFVEGRDCGTISEIYYMHHLPSGKGYVGLAYHGAHERMKTHWGCRNRETDPSSMMMRNSSSPFEWICWPVERFPGRREGHKQFHKKAAHREGWWASFLGTWWPRGFNVGSTGGYHKGGAKADWNTHRENFHREWHSKSERGLADAKQWVKDICEAITSGQDVGWEQLEQIPIQQKRDMLQALNMDPTLGGPHRRRLERLVREELKRHKELKKKPKGDFVKLLITHKGWNAAEVRKVIREPQVCKLHPDPTAAERIWVCERNVPPIGSWLLNYTALEDEDLTAEKKAELQYWENINGEKDPKNQRQEETCPCFSHILHPQVEDVWKGHVCTADVRKFNSPLVRGLLIKGHAYKLEQRAETLLQELGKGLDGYIQYKTKREGDPVDFEAWKSAIIRRVKEKLTNSDNAMFPTGDTGQKEIRALQEHLVFLKEDRAPHVVVAMCKYRYMYERDQYLYEGHTFQVDKEDPQALTQRHWDFHEKRGLQPNRHIPYIYGIWKSAKRNLRWISGVRKDKEEGKGQEQVKPEGSIAGAGKELVGVLTQVMHSLRSKDAHNRRKGFAKACWFVESVEEVAQPLRFEAADVAKRGATATTVDFVTMYPSFDQKLLKDRLRDAICEAWEWEEKKLEKRHQLRARKDGWVHLTPEEAAQDASGSWSKEGVLEMVEFVIDNGYIRRGSTLLKQVKGFGMGLACAPQIANLGCYPVERDFAATKKPEDLEYNYRFIDDILSLSGCIPTAEQYGMLYKHTKTNDGELVYLGMVLKWLPLVRTGEMKFITGMHFRDCTYPIRIRRYPGAGSMVTDSQRLGVLTGQFIRGQRLCSTLQMFKFAVQGIALAATRRGYFRHELDRMWGKFLADWWKAEEIRRGELRSWFRKMTRVVRLQVQKEGTEHSKAAPFAKKLCRFGSGCLYRDVGCPFQHKVPVHQQPACQRCCGHNGEVVRKNQATLWLAAPDGSCLFHCAAMSNEGTVALELRRKVAAYVREEWDTEMPGLGMSVGQILTTLGWDKEGYLASVVSHIHWAEEPELALLPSVLKFRLRVFLDHGDHWQECTQYGSTGPLRRVVFHQNRGHYDAILMDGSPDPERSHHTTHWKVRKPLLVVPTRAENKAEAYQKAAQKRRAKIRREKVEASRQGSVSIDETWRRGDD